MYAPTLFSKSYRLYVVLVFTLFTSGKTIAVPQPLEPLADETIAFLFRTGSDTLYRQGNEQEFERLYRFVDQHRDAIFSGHIPIYVDGYCASAANFGENRRIARVRSNRIKSELIIHKGLLEKHFTTRNHTTALEGEKDIVTVTFRLKRPDVTETVRQEKTEPQIHPQEQPVAETTRPQEQPVEQTIQPPVPKRNISSFDLRTNLLYDAMLLPTIGLEWRLNETIGIKADVSYSHWGSEHGNTQKLWMVSPELRWYMSSSRRFYMGLGVNAGQANLHKYPLGNLLNTLYTDGAGYQGNFVGGGLTAGYRLPLGKAFAFDFNIGLGYTRFSYDTFGIVEGVRVYRQKDLTRNLWGPTQAGITLIWRWK